MQPQKSKFKFRTEYLATDLKTLNINTTKQGFTIVL